jgi:hypothetical protein
MRNDGALVISLDFELVRGVRDGVPAMLDLFAERGIACTGRRSAFCSSRRRGRRWRASLRVRSSDLPSRLWSHPTIWGYLATGLRRGVW